MKPSKFICADCCVCCYFEEDEKYFAPLFTDAEVEKIVLQLGENARKNFGLHNNSRRVYQVKLLKSQKRKDAHVCPFLDEKSHQCIVYPVRPYDCRIWPFMLSSDKEKNGKIILSTFSKDFCKITREMDESEYGRFKEKILEWMEQEKVMDLVREYPELILGYEPDTEFIMDVTDEITKKSGGREAREGA